MRTVNEKGFVNIFILFALVAVLSAVVVSQVVVKQKRSTPVSRACTQEAKQCPDGSYVGRTGPNCEFTACPATVTQCNTDSDCKLISNGCTCAAIPSSDPRTSLDSNGQVCIWNDCFGPKVPVTAVCRQNKCVRSDKVQAATVDTSTWKTYRNETYGIELKYPADWYVPPSADDTHRNGLFEHKVGPGLPGARSITVFPDEVIGNISDLKAWVVQKRGLESDVPSAVKYTKKYDKYISVANVEAYQVYRKFEVTGGTECEHCDLTTERLEVTTYVPFREAIPYVPLTKVFEITTELDGSQVLEEEMWLKIYNGILSTFKFIPN